MWGPTVAGDSTVRLPSAPQFDGNHLALENVFCFPKKKSLGSETSTLPLEDYHGMYGTVQHVQHTYMYISVIYIYNIHT